MPRRRSKTPRKHLETLDRRRYVFELRRTGATYEMIYQTLQQHPTWSKLLPPSYNERRVHADVMLMIKHMESALGESVNAIRQQEIDRIDRMLLGVWSRAQMGDDRAIASVVSLMARRARYLPGLEAPMPVAPVTPDGTESYKPLGERKVNDEYVRDVAGLLAQYGLFQLNAPPTATNGVHVDIETNGAPHD